MTARDWSAAKARMEAVAQGYWGELPRDRKVRCPFHADGSPSLHVYRDGWHCYGCGEHGDAVDLVMRLDGVNKTEAYERIMGACWTPTAATMAAAAVDLWQEAEGAPDEAPAHPRLGPATKAYAYHRGDHLAGWVLRWDTPEGKTIRQATWRRHVETGELAWRWQAMDAPRPLYRPEVTRDVCVIVEGEKAADHLRSLRVEAVSWPGGANAWKQADWSSLAVKRAIMWPDADAPGLGAMEGIAAILRAAGVSLRWVDVSDLPDGHDAADVAPDEALARLRAARPEELTATVPQAVAPAADTWPFRCLGYRGNRYYFLESRGQQVVDYGPREVLSPGSLLVLAPIEWWDSLFKGRSGVDWTAAGSAIVARCMEAGYYGPHRERGRGIWRDEGRIVYHRGSEAIVDGQPTRLVALRSKYAYAIGDELPGIASAPLTDDEAARWVLGTASMFSWKQAAYGPLLAGWVATAIVCGALRWRPHVWLTGAAGSGKTTILNHYVGGLLGGLALLAQGASSEAGIRQALGTDARPVVFDESESQSESEQKRIAAVLATIRQASSETASQVYKGTAGNKAVTYHIRSSFCLGSIQVGLAQQADRERITRLVLASAKAGDITPDVAEQTYTAWLAARAAWPDDISARLLHRMLRLVPVLLEAVETFTLALVPYTAGRREADQLGALLAGAWCLQASRPPTADEAAASVAAYDWTTVLDGSSETDAERARSALLGIITQGEGRASVADRVEAVRNPFGHNEEHVRVLGWYGLRLLEDGRLFVAHTNENRTNALRQTPWATDLTGLLRQLPGTTTGQARVNGATTKGVCLALPAVTV